MIRDSIEDSFFISWLNISIIIYLQFTSILLRLITEQRGYFLSSLCFASPLLSSVTFSLLDFEGREYSIRFSDEDDVIVTFFTTRGLNLGVMKGDTAADFLFLQSSRYTSSIDEHHEVAEEKATVEINNNEEVKSSEGEKAGL